MTKKLIPLDEYNQKRHSYWVEQTDYPRPNGLACPKCGAELLDKESATLLTAPPMMNVFCSNCNYVAVRLL